MRYLFNSSMKSEIHARKDYIYDSMNLWTRLIEYNNDFLCLESIPDQAVDIFFITGHNFEIKDFLKSNLDKIYENTIVAITCSRNINFKSLNLSGKKLYIPNQNKKNRLASLLVGTEYGFNFDLTESEIIFYNSKGKKDMNNRLNSSFSRIH